jgi:NAD(P)-dependent dehydrogenase (short-subunit alcohol dehydrogenase family)
MAARVALITGGSRGIGTAVCLKLSSGGAYAFINYLRNEDAARETLRLLKNDGGDGELSQFDVADNEAVDRAVHGVVERKGRIDILVNNTGVSLKGLLVRIKEADLDRLLRTNLKGTLYCWAASRYMLRQRWGGIINFPGRRAIRSEIRYRSAGWAYRRMSPVSSHFSPPRMPGISPARSSASTADFTCSAASPVPEAV